MRAGCGEPPAPHGSSAEGWRSQIRVVTCEGEGARLPAKLRSSSSCCCVFSCSEMHQPFVALAARRSQELPDLPAPPSSGRHTTAAAARCMRILRWGAHRTSLSRCCPSLSRCGMAASLAAAAEPWQRARARARLRACRPAVAPGRRPGPGVALSKALRAAAPLTASPTPPALHLSANVCCAHMHATAIANALIALPVSC